MMMLQIIFEAIGLVVGSIVAAIALCWIFWNLLKIFHHPEWGAPLGIFTLFLVFGLKLQRSEFLWMVAVFSAVGTVAGWVEGRAWRTEFHRLHGGFS